MTVTRWSTDILGPYSSRHHRQSHSYPSYNPWMAL